MRSIATSRSSSAGRPSPLRVVSVVGLIAALWASLLVGACASAELPPDYTELTAAKLVQRAQEAVDRDNYKLAINYYDALREGYPEDTERVLWATYEIGFLSYKMKRYEEAVGLFDELLARYAQEDGPALPQGPAVLAEKMRTKISEQYLSTD